MYKILEVGTSDLMNHKFPPEYDVLHTYRKPRPADNPSAIFNYEVHHTPTSRLVDFITDLYLYDELRMVVFTIGENRKVSTNLESKFDREQLFETNCFHMVDTALQVINSIRRTGEPQVKLHFLFISSEAAKMTYTQHATYAASKAALSSYARNLSLEFGGTAFTFDLLEPPMVKTRLSNDRGMESQEYFDKFLLPKITSILEQK